MRNLIDTSKMTFNDYLEEMRPELFENVMSSGNGLDGWSNYMGHDWSGWFCGPAVNRDSDTLDRSNWEVSKDLLPEVEGLVEIRSVNHWACGWFEQIMVKAAPENIEAIKTLYDIKCALEQYPVLDESHFSELEHSEYSDYAEQTKQEVADSLLFLAGLDDGSIHWTKDSTELSPELKALREGLESEALELGYYLQLLHQESCGPGSCLDKVSRWDLEDSPEGAERFSRTFNEYSYAFNRLSDLGYFDTLKDGVFYQLLESIFKDEKRGS